MKWKDFVTNHTTKNHSPFDLNGSMQIQLWSYKAHRDQTHLKMTFNVCFFFSSATNKRSVGRSVHSFDKLSWDLYLQLINGCLMLPSLALFIKFFICCWCWAKPYFFQNQTIFKRTKTEITSKCATMLAQCFLINRHHSWTRTLSWFLLQLNYFI